MLKPMPRHGALLIDVLVALAFGAYWLSAEAGRIGGDSGWTRVALIVLIVIVMGTSGRTPRVGIGALVALVVVHLLLINDQASGLWPLGIGLVYAAARTGVHRPTLARTGLSVLLIFAAVAVALPADGAAMAGILTALVAVALAGGHVYRLLRSRSQLLAERLELEQNLADAGRELALISERSRIARDVHDIMAQSLSIVLVQADGAAKLVRSDPDRSEASLGVISDVARSSLIEVRMLIESIGPTPRTPDQPTLAHVPQLLERFHAAGLTVGFVEAGERLALTEGQQLAVYRIIQEALTNALRHSGDQPNAELRLLWDSSALLLEVTSRGRPGRAPSIGSGMGLLGMKERAELAGGWLTAEQLADSESFVVTASVPAPPGEVVL
jgi:signal transduction histidine kinase